MQDKQVNKILRQLEQGNLSEAEAEKMLQQIIDQALSGKLDAPVDMALVERCQSLIWNLRTKGQFPYQDHALKNQRKLERKLKRESRKKRCLPLIKAAVAAGLFVLIFTGIAWRWVDGRSTPDRQQYILQGHEIASTSTEYALAQPVSDDRIYTDSKEEAIAFLGFDPGFPQVLMDNYLASQYQFTILPIWIDCQVIYRSPDDIISLSMYYLLNPEEFYYSIEQNDTGYEQTICGYNAYITQNIDRTILTWSEDNRVYVASGHFLPEDFSAIIQAVMNGQ